MTRVLVVEDAPQDLEILREEVEALGHEVVSARDLASARAVVEGPAPPDVVLSDIRLPDGRGTDLLEGASAIPLIFVTAFGEVEVAVEAMRKGAFHYLTKPVRSEELAVLLERALRAAETQKELARLRAAAGRAVVEEDFVARSPAMREVLSTIQAAAESDSTVLVLGESGTGKEIVARLLHRLSARANGPFVAVNCGAIPATLLEADLFGHEKGAFTGAAARRVGKFERAGGGTLFLDEIATLPADLQVRLLRAIQEREIERLGGDAPIGVDIRLVAATNVDLDARVKDGSFREDLFYRLNVISVHLPPLRQRREEIPVLIARFLTARSAGEREVDPEAMDILMRHDWPGNVRQLENALERATVLSRGGAILARHLPEEVRGGRVSARNGEASSEAATFPPLDEVKRRHIEAALARAGGRREEAAHLLGVHRNTLRSLIRKYGLSPAAQ